MSFSYSNINEIKKQPFSSKKQDKHIQNINQKNEEGDTLLHCAVMDGDISKIKECISQNAEIDIKNAAGRPPLYYALIALFNKNYPHAFEVIRILIENHANPNITLEGCKPIYVAALTGHYEATKFFAAFKQKDFQDQHDEPSILRDSQCPLFNSMFNELTSIEKWIKILELLQKYDPDFGTYSSILLARAMLTLPNTDSEAFKNHLKIIDYLLDHGARFNTKQASPLHWLLYNRDISEIENGYEQVINRCMKKRFDINNQDKRGYTLLHAAALHSNHQALLTILKFKPNMSIPNEDNMTPLHLAAKFPKQFDILLPSLGVRKYLFTLKNDKEMQELCKQSEVHSHQINFNVLLMLLDKSKSSLTIVDKFGFKPIDYLEKAHNEWIESSQYKLWDINEQNNYMISYLKVSELFHSSVPSPKSPSSIAYIKNGFFSKLSSLLHFDDSKKVTLKPQK